MILFRFFRCPHCWYLIKFDIGMVDVLGPPVVICKGCQNQVHTDLKEWVALSTWGRIEYILVTIFAMIFGSYFLAGCAYIGLTFQLFSDAAWRDGRFLAMFCGAGLLTAMIKTLIVVLSLKRTKNNSEFVTASLATWHMNFGLYFTLAFVLLLVLDYFFVFRPLIK